MHMQMENTNVKGLLVHELREETGGGADTTDCITSPADAPVINIK